MENESKVQCVVRVEPGSLGPEGLDFVEGFCEVANKYFVKVYPELLLWHIVPRYDKSLPELDFFMNEKHLNGTQTEKMLSMIGKDQDQLEIEAMDIVSCLIDKYLGHKY